MQAEDGQLIQLLAVDPDTFAQVASYPTGLTDLTISDLIRVFQPEGSDRAQSRLESSETGDDVLPAIFAVSALPAGKSVRDQLFVAFAGHRLPLGVQATIGGFPTLSDPFAVVSLPELEARVGSETLAGFGTREAWLAVEPAQHEALARQAALQGRILDNAQVRLRELRSDALAQGVRGTLQLNTLMLILFSVTAFFLVHLVAAQGRVRSQWGASEFGVLRAMGVSIRQWLTLLGIESALVLVLGLLAGTIIGLGLSYIMIPYLSQALESLAAVTTERILIDCPAIARLNALLFATYGTELVLVLLVLLRTRVHGALWMEDE